MGNFIGSSFQARLTKKHSKIVCVHLIAEEIAQKIGQTQSQGSSCGDRRIRRCAGISSSRRILCERNRKIKEDGNLSLA